MEENPIMLRQVLNIRGLDTQFHVSPKISKRQVLEFFSDATDILKELDPQINYEGDVHVFSGRTPRSRFQLPSKGGRIEKYLQVREGNPEVFKIGDVVRTHTLRYERNPELGEILQDPQYDRNPHIGLLRVNPDIVIRTNRPNYSAEELVKRVLELPYVRLSKEYKPGIFNPLKIADLAGLEVKSEYIN